MVGLRNARVVWLAGLPAGTPTCLAGWPARLRGCLDVRSAVRPEWLDFRRPRCLPGDAGGLAGKNHWARSRPAATWLVGEANGKADESRLDPPLSNAAMLRYEANVNAQSFDDFLNDDVKRNDEAEINTMCYGWVEISWCLNTVRKDFRNEIETLKIIYGSLV